jgi:hypothetical protein
MPNLVYLNEPALQFRHGQALEDPRDGLSLFGPLDNAKPYGIRAGVIGTQRGIRIFESWVRRIQTPIANVPPSAARPSFPGFEAVFRTPWKTRQTCALEVQDADISSAVYLDDPHQRVHETVEVFASRIVDAIVKDGVIVDIWFVVIPDDVWKYCRPQSRVEATLRRAVPRRMTPAQARHLRVQSSMFQEDHDLARAYDFEVNFHNQLKARLLSYLVPTQIVRESTIGSADIVDARGKPLRDLSVMESAIAFTLSTAAFYKSGGRPWKLDVSRAGVCYVGLAFKTVEAEANSTTACCAAQMFLDSGDGLVFKGAVGPWHNPKRGEFHMSRDAARALISLAMESYVSAHGSPPAELFLHGRTRFNDEEWQGFQDGADRSTNLVGVRIRQTSDLKLYRKATHPVLRGLAYLEDSRTGYLWSKGFVPRLRTYPGREVPNPLVIEICRGDADLRQTMEDVLRLTKLNYNACQFGDGVPVTLKFADAVGEILTAGRLEDKQPPLAFRHYI